jgi:hypothetical protein
VLNRLTLTFLLLVALAPDELSLAHEHGPPGIEILQPLGPGHVRPSSAVGLPDHQKSAKRARPPLAPAQSPVAAKVEMRAAGTDHAEPKPVAGLTVGAGQDLVLSPSGPHLALRLSNWRWSSMERVASSST